MSIIIGMIVFAVAVAISGCMVAANEIYRQKAGLALKDSSGLQVVAFYVGLVAAIGLAKIMGAY